MHPIKQEGRYTLKNKTYLIVQDCYDDIYFDSDEEDNGGEGKKDKVNDTTNYL